METIYVIGASVAAVGAGVAIWLGSRRPDKMKEAIEEAIESKKIDPIIQYIEEQSLSDKPNVWDKAMDKLWKGYDRDLAARLLLVAAKLGDQDLNKRWTEKITSIEPEMAMKILGRRFILDTLELPEETIPKASSLPPRRGTRVVSRKKGKAPAKKKKKRMK